MKTKTNRFLAWLLSALTVFSLFSVNAVTLTASAAAVVKKVSIVDYPRSADKNKSGWGHDDLKLMNGWYMTSSKKMVMRAIGGYDGATCYCIEPGVGQHTGDKLTQKGEDYWDYIPGNQTIPRRDIQKLIGRILQYGWTGNNNTSWVSTNATHADQMGNAKATQILIHEVIVGERRADFSKVDAHDYGCNNAVEQIKSSCPIYRETMENYRRIEAAVQNHTVTPNFGGRQFFYETAPFAGLFLYLKGKDGSEFLLHSESPEGNALPCNGLRFLHPIASLFKKRLCGDRGVCGDGFGSYRL